MPRLTILIAEDNAVNVALLKQFIEVKQQHKLIVAVNGKQAVELFQQHQPDLVLMDINMPIMNGLDAIIAIRSMPLEIWVPIIVMSALSADQDVINGFKAGADDYLVKPVNLDILAAKLKSTQRMVNLQKQNQEASLALLQHNHELEQENILAKRLADRMLQLGNLSHFMIDYWSCPNQRFSGDVIAVSPMIDNRLYVMLADSTGHGLTAALPTLMLTRTFHAMTEKQLALSDIATEMNKVTKRYLPIERFVATALFLIDFEQHTIEYWNGGLPSALLVDKAGNIIHQFESHHLAIGVKPDDLFDAITNRIEWQQECELIAYSDGVIEAESPEGNPYGEAVLLDVIKASHHEQRIATIKHHLLDFMSAEYGKDDISLLSVKLANIER